MRHRLCLALTGLSLSLAGCGQAVPNGNAALANDSAPDVVTPAPVAVRVGEMGPNFGACSAVGTTRHLEPAERLPVRASPFDNAAETGAVAAGARFFVCARSIDQKWFGIVYDENGRLDARCGVSDPLPARRDYAGPCQSGWVSTPFVKLVAGDEPAAPNQPKPNEAKAPEPASG